MKLNTDRLYDYTNEGRGKLARNLGINYVVVTKKIFDTPDLTSEDYVLEYSNKDIDIYKVSY